MRKRVRQSRNLLELTPVQQAPWETSEQGGVVVLVPKFQNELVSRWIMPRLRHPYMRVKLDTLGSFVWKQCDGRTSVATIAERMKSEFGDSTEGVHNRICTFLIMLEKSELVHLFNRQSDVTPQ